MARVAEVLIARGDGFVTEVTGEVMLQFGGFAGDRHFGLMRRSDARTPWHPRGTVIGKYPANLDCVDRGMYRRRQRYGDRSDLFLLAGRDLAFKNVPESQRHAAINAGHLPVRRYFVRHGRKRALPTAGESRRP